MISPTRSFNRFPQIAADLMPLVDRVVRVATFNVNETIKRSFSETKHGVTYKLPGGRAHQASAGGEAPAVQYGTFTNTIRPVFPKPGLGAVVTADEKGPHLEFGTHRMAARPSFRPALEHEKTAYGRAMQSALARGIK